MPIILFIMGSLFVYGGYIGLKKEQKLKNEDK